MAVNPITAVGRFFGQFFGRTIGDAASYGIGGAITRPIDPLLQELTNQTWAVATAGNVGRPLDAAEAAEIVAEDVDSRPWGVGQAGQAGYTEEVFDAVLGATLTAPGAGELFQLWRRNLIGDADFVHGLRKAKLEPLWDDPLKGLHDVLLSSEELAMGQQQGFVTETRANEEGGLQGVTEERQQIRFDMAGLPPGVETALTLWRRGIINQETFDQIVREGHTKTKYTGDLEQLKRQLLSAATYVRLYLKGWITKPQMNAGGAQWGYTPEDMNLWFESEGRPATAHQIHIGYARGGSLPGAANEEEAILTSVKQSDIRPEYGDLIVAQRYTMPSAFVARSLTQTGVWSEEKARERLIWSGWIPEDAAEAAKAWASGGTGSATDKHLSKAQGQLWTKTHTSYVNGRIDQPTATTALEKAGVPAEAVADILGVWDEEASLVRAGPSKADIRKQYREGSLTIDEATAELVDLGWSQAQAQDYLKE